MKRLKIMKSKSESPECPICDANKWVEASHTMELTHENESLTVENLAHSECEDCGYELVLPYQSRINDALIRDARRSSSGLLTGSEILRIRKSLKLTQQDTAELIGCAVNTFSKYERGVVTQSAAMDQLLRILDSLPEAIELLRKNKHNHLMSENVYKSPKIQSSVVASTNVLFGTCKKTEHIRDFKVLKAA